ncbi:MAG TPA: ABC transporter substrate-binding protein [Candidatus Binatia bacterium]|jgi:ABC-type nitrate/sulfonate/bicarbonate transport system substrate-binding protein
MKQTRNRIFSLLLAAMLIAPAAYSFAADAPKEKITFGYSAVSPTMAGVWMAKEIGAFEKYGLDAQLIYIASGAIVIQALVGGSLNAALGASNAVIAAELKGAQVIAVGSNTSRPGMVLWVQPEISRPEQLVGKRLAITRYGSSSDFVTRLITKRLGLDGKVEIRQFGGVVEADMGFRAHQAEGRVASQSPDPQAKALVDAAELGIPYSMNLLAVSNDFYKKSPGTVVRIVKAYVEGIAALRTRKQQALQMLAKYMGPRGGAPEMHYEFVVKYLDTVPRVDPAAIDTILEMVGHTGPVHAKLYDNAIIDKLKAEGFFDKLQQAGGK